MATNRDSKKCRWPFLPAAAMLLWVATATADEERDAPTLEMLEYIGKLVETGDELVGPHSFIEEEDADDDDAARPASSHPTLEDIDDH